MRKFERVKQYLEDAVNNTTIGRHGNFWRPLNLDQFKTFAVNVPPRVVNWPLLVVGDGANSNLIKALQGVAPFGLDAGVPGATLNRMPDPDFGYAKMPDDRIKFIKDWIDAGCPDEDETPTPRDSGS
ncbi:MAG: hypothetical protein WCJ31_07485 [Planctomycetia bacterium]